MNTLKLTDRAGLALASAYLRHAPSQAGRWRLIDRYLPLLRQHGPALGQRIVSTRYGFKFHADLGDWLGQYVYLTGVYEPPTAQVIAGLLNEGDAMLDIGANVGFFSLLGAKRVGKSGQVHSFEPIPTVRARLQANVALNGFANVTVSGVALSDQPGELEMYEGPEGHKGLSSLRPLAHASQKISVTVERLDDTLDTLPCIRLAKIDVEGAEQNALMGMAALIERDHPDIVLEITDSYLQQFGHSANGLVRWLADRGYHAYRIDEQYLVPFSAPIPSGWPDQFNVLFTTAPTLPPALQERVHGH
jgi:FkbM family methyltransferase